jgi:hypothetical protein
MLLPVTTKSPLRHVATSTVGVVIAEVPLNDAAVAKSLGWPAAPCQGAALGRLLTCDLLMLFRMAYLADMA